MSVPKAYRGYDDRVCGNCAFNRYHENSEVCGPCHRIEVENWTPVKCVRVWKERIRNDR